MTDLNTFSEAKEIFLASGCVSCFYSIPIIFSSHHVFKMLQPFVFLLRPLVQERFPFRSDVPYLL
jgi:hypothetical protein